MVRNSACRSVVYGGTDRHAPNQLRQSRCLATMCTSDCATAGIPDADLRIGRLVDALVRASSVCCQQNLLVSFQCNYGLTIRGLSRTMVLVCIAA